jgi:hypothetical protein
MRPEKASAESEGEGGERKKMVRRVREKETKVGERVEKKRGAWDSERE